MEGVSMETEPLHFQLTPGPDVTDIRHMTSGDVSHCVINPADNPPYGNTSHISCVPTPKNLLTSNPSNPGNVKSGTSFTIGDTEQSKARYFVSPNMMHVTPFGKGQGGVISESHLFISGKKRAKENVTGIFRLFAHLLRDVPQSMDCYLIIHHLTINDLNDLLGSCELASWRPCRHTEDSFEARMDICLSMTDTLMEITPSQFEGCTILASTLYPDAWMATTTTLEALGRYLGCNSSLYDTYRQLAASISNIGD